MSVCRKGWTSLKVSLGAMGLLAALACGGGGGGGSATTPPPNPPPTIASFTAVRTTLTQGAATDVTAVFNGGTASVDHGVGALTSGVPVSSGPVNADTTFLLTVSGGGGMATRTLAIHAVPPAAAPVISAPAVVTASVPGWVASISPQAECTYEWQVTGAVFGGGGTTATGTTVSFQPTGPGSVQLSCRGINAAGDAGSATVRTLTALPAPAIQGFLAGAATVASGTGTTLTAQFTGGTATVDHGIGAVASGVSVSTGALTVGTTFTLTVTNAAGTQASQSTVVSVAGTPVITSFTASPTTVITGSAATLSAAFTGGTGSVDHGLGPLTSGIPLSTGPLTQDTTFLLTVTNGVGVSTTASATVHVVPAPTITAFTAAKGTVTWDTGTTLTPVFSGGTGSIDSGIGAVSSGVPVATGPLRSSLHYTLTVTAPGGTSISRGVDVSVVDPPYIQDLQVARTPITAGESTSLTPIFLNGTGLLDHVLGAVSSGTPISTGPLSTDTTYTLTVTNAAGTSTSASALVQVVPAPEITAFSASAMQVSEGQRVTLSGTFSGGTGLVNGLQGDLPSPFSRETEPLTVDTTFTLEVINPAGARTNRSLTVQVVPRPRILSFKGSPGVIAPGLRTTLTFQFTGGTAVLEPGLGTVLSGGSLEVAPTEATDYTLRVTNALGVSTTAGVALRPGLVFDLPGGTPLLLHTLPAGSFVRGSDHLRARSMPAHPAHPVMLTEGFFMGRTEVTQAQWIALMGSNPSVNSLARGRSTEDLDRPVDNVSWNDLTQANGFLDRLNTATAGVRPAGLVFRLPTEAEWEYACRAGSSTPYFWGEDPDLIQLDTYAWHQGNSLDALGRPISQPVETRSPNAFGLYDMAGNVSEWTGDAYGLYGLAREVDPTGPGYLSSYRMMRGSSYDTAGGYSDSAWRWTNPASMAFAEVGFRVVLARPLAQPNAPLIGAFEAMDRLVLEGQTTKLVAVFEAGATAVVDQGIGPVASGLLVSTPPVTTDTTYTLTVTGTNGAQRIARVSVGACPRPTITSFSADRTTLRQGETATLSWAYPEGTFTSQRFGSIAPAIGQVPTSGTLQIQPAITTTYVLKVRTAMAPGLGGSEAEVTRTVTITVIPADALAFTLPSATPLRLQSIPGGSFTMGSPFTEPGRVSDGSEGPQHGVSVQPFLMGTFEITQAQWLAVMGTNPSRMSVAGGGSPVENLERPVDSVTWNDVHFPHVGFLDRLNALTQGARPAGTAFRLPTEAEWEYACRAGTTSRYFWGEDLDLALIDRYAFYVFSPASNLSVGSVGEHLPNPFGLYDMSGGVREWCEDAFHVSYLGAPTDGSAWTQGGTNEKVTRGGFSEGPADAERSASRFPVDPNQVRFEVGLRVVLAPEPTQTRILGFAAQPARIHPGGSTTLHFSFAHGTGVVDQGLGPVASLGGLAVSPTQTTTYTLTVTGSDGTVRQAQCTVEVVPPASVTLTASAPVVNVGTPVTLTPTFSGGSGPLIQPGNLMAGASGQGIQVVPTGTTTYTCTITDPEGQLHAAQVTVTVLNPNPLRSISGTVTYDHVPTGPAGPQFGAATPRPIRGATVQVIEADQLLQSGTTDEAGHYSLTYRPLGITQAQVVVLSERLAEPAISVVNNTGANTLYGVSAAIGVSDTLDLHATHGWTGTAYNYASRLAAPFAILDTLLTTHRAVLAARPALHLPPLVVNWSIDNVPEWGEVALGQILSSHFQPATNQIYVLGREAVDTDEFDDHVLAHEWGHFLEHNLSRSDSPGGSHGFGDVLDPRLAFGEGFGNAISGLGLYPDTLYVDTFWFGTDQVAGGFDVATEPAVTDDPTPGPFSELSLTRALFHLVRTEGGGAWDQAATGFGPLLDTLAGPQKATPALTTLAPFAVGLKAQPGVDSAKVDVLLAHFQVGPLSSIWGDGDAGLRAMYLPIAALPFSTTLTLKGGFASNMQAQNRYLTFLGTGGAVRIESACDQDVDLAVFQQGQVVGSATTGSGQESVTVATQAGLTYVVVVSGSTGALKDYPVTLTLSLP